MNHLGTKPLITDRIILRPFVPEDARPMFQNWASDPMVTKYLTWPAHASISVSRMVISNWIKHYDDPAYYQWALELKAIGEPIGSISAVKIDESTKTVEIGYCIGRPWWGQGLVSEAVRALLSFFFEQVGMERIIACHHPDNPNSGRVMQKSGMTYEGKKYNRDKGMDLCWYAITVREYYASQDRK